MENHKITQADFDEYDLFRILEDKYNAQYEYEFEYYSTSPGATLLWHRLEKGEGCDTLRNIVFRVKEGYIQNVTIINKA